MNPSEPCVTSLGKPGCASALPPAELSRARWFEEEVHVHEASLRAYLRGAFPWLRDVDDMIQDCFARLWRAQQQGGVRSSKAFLYATARHAALDLYRHQQVVVMNPVGDMAELHVLEERPDAAETTSKNQELELLAEAISALPDRCRQVLTLKKIYELSQKEIAARLGISEHTVEVQVANGMRRCAEYLRSRGVIRQPSSR